MLPVGAGTELEGPGGDGFISVITPASPVGKAIEGARAGDIAEVVVAGSDREWTVVDVR
jgi:transcription elongation GreA/GreB family factor